jgi:hypothetical protein
VWLVEILVGHGSERRIGERDAAARRNAVKDVNAGEGEMAGGFG